MIDVANVITAFNEYMSLMKLSYESIASYIDVFTAWEPKISASFVNLVTEHFLMGNLDNYIEKLRSEQKTIDNLLLEIWFAQILDGLMYLWNQNIVHRNLKPESIFLRGEDNEQNCSIVIGDMVPLSVAYDLRIRPRLPRRTY
ncbi:unnamed protein product [Didymodactylos carnosus]|uniref:non-specific serine/threonine protein kinase n=1 Tax=Didymodactylos carnosus TaxID=1234261 RepID=A0A8S2D7U1_9BILA|nr:unnamed protein product [Didymodactylos carnosus]CAF3680734.1 unnamed protein product [Didymodactylos carnosus]